jgi:hypothetical protein
MSDAIERPLQQALALTMDMLAAATQDNWTLVTELDTRRQAYLQQIHDAAIDPQHRHTLRTLEANNRALLERVTQVREGVELQLSQHQYNHRALRTYVSSTR